MGLLRRCRWTAPVLFLLASTALAAVPATEREALLALHNAAGGDQWVDKSGWNGAVGTECDWFGVRCNPEETTVVALFLYANNLSGTLPPQIAQLSNLEELLLGVNQLEGAIPLQLAQLRRLELLYLDNNRFSGGIPEFLGDMTSLRVINLSNLEQLGGTIPTRLGNLVSLEELSLESASLTGRIPAELGMLAALKLLNLAHNQLEGPIPAQLGNLSALEYLWMSDNRLSDQIPADLGLLRNLKSLYLSQNQLMGTIPASLGELLLLEDLVLDTNRLSGTIPFSLGQLSALRLLWLYSNELSGEIPRELGNLASLEEMVLGFNQLTGEIPLELGQLATLRALELYSNRLEGRIPAELAGLQSLEQLNLFANLLTGGIPQELSQLSNLRVLDLSSNSLGGTIPAELGQLSKLEHLSLADTDIVGAIPDDLGSLRELRNLFLEVNALTGTFPLWITNLPHLVNLYLYGNQLSGPIPEALQNVTTLQTLLLAGNQFTGTIPAGLMNLTNLTYLALSDNLLTGPIPADIGRLSRLQYLELHGNQLTGGIPPSFGQLSELIYVVMSDNSLSGPLPPLGQLKRLELLLLSNNELGNTIPTDIGELTALQLLSLSSNRFAGQIPPQIGNLKALRELELGANALRGPIPREILELTNLVDGQSDFSYNALSTSDTAIVDFLNRKQEGRDWQATQTTAPINVQVSGQTATTVTLTWGRTGYVFDAGGYQVTVTAGAAPVKVQTTPDKTFNAIVIDELTPQTAYSFVVQTVSYPHDFQKNLLISDPAPVVTASTTAAQPQPAQIVVSTLPFGLVQSTVADESRLEDFYVLMNVGNLSTTIAFTQEGNFFTQEPATLTLNGGEEATVSLQAVPQPAGVFVGASIPAGEGVRAGFRVPVNLLSVASPTGTVVAEASTSRIDLAQPEEVVRFSGSANFANSGNAQLHGVLIADVPWILPQTAEVIIPPGQQTTVTFEIDRSLREDREGTATGNLSLLYLQRTSTSGAQLRWAQQTAPGGLSTATITVVDTAKPPVGSSNLPPLAAGQIALFIPGVGHLLGAGGAQFVSDVSIANVFSVADLTDLQMYFTPESAGVASSSTNLDPLALNTGLQFGNVVKSIFNADQAGTLQLRTRDWDKIAVSANLLNVSNPAGIYGLLLPVFRSDRAIPAGQHLYLTGLRAGPTTETNLYLQEAAGLAANVVVEFFDAAGSSLGVLTESLEGFRLRRLMNRVPAGAVTARVSNRADSTGRILAYATPTDRTSGDLWTVADWSRHFAAGRSEPVLIPVAGITRGLGGALFVTDVDIANVGDGAASGTLRYIIPNAAPLERTVSLGVRQTRTFVNVAGELFGAVNSVGYLVFIPRSGEFALSSRTYGSTSTEGGAFATGVPSMPLHAALRLGQSRVIGGVEVSSRSSTHDQKPATFRTNIGLVETTGEAVTVRVTVLFADTRSKSLGVLKTLSYELRPRETRLVTNLNAELEQFSRGADLRNVQLQFDVVAGGGAVVVFTSSVDNGTGDSIFRLE